MMKSRQIRKVKHKNKKRITRKSEYVNEKEHLVRRERPVVL